MGIKTNRMNLDKIVLKDMDAPTERIAEEEANEYGRAVDQYKKDSKILLNKLEKNAETIKKLDADNNRNSTRSN